MDGSVDCRALVAADYINKSTVRAPRSRRPGSQGASIAPPSEPPPIADFSDCRASRWQNRGLRSRGYFKRMCASKVAAGGERGWIIPIGGAEEKENSPQILRRFVELC